MAQWVEYVNSDRGTLADERRANGRDKPWGVRYWGIGNESWGCGGNMTPEYYSDVMLRYTTFVKQFGGTRPFPIASGASDFNYRWTEVLMQAFRRKQIFDGLSLHHYTLPTGKWERKGSATRFEEAEWAAVMQNTLCDGRAVTPPYRDHGPVPTGAIGSHWSLMNGAPGTTPKTAPPACISRIRSATPLVAGINLNIFNNHCKRVRMANIAQTVNVLQAMILTKGDEMVLTPSYFVFRMYKASSRRDDAARRSGIAQVFPRRNHASGPHRLRVPRRGRHACTCRSPTLIRTIA